MRSLVPRHLSSLGISRLTNAELIDVVAAVKLAAPDSDLVQSDPATQASVASMEVRGDALAQAGAGVTDARTTLMLALAAEAECRAELQGELRSFVTLITNRAKSPTDVQKSGLPPARPRPPRNQQPQAPVQIDNRPPRTGHGRTVVIVHETGPTRLQYIAEQSVDGLTWAALGVERGKTRIVTGRSGDQIWVRFAAVRGRLVSAWSTPILVTIP
jgi:hypothetical protein